MDLAKTLLRVSEKLEQMRMHAADAHSDSESVLNSIENLDRDVRFLCSKAVNQMLCEVRPAEFLSICGAVARDIAALLSEYNDHWAAQIDLVMGYCTAASADELLALPYPDLQRDRLYVEGWPVDDGITATPLTPGDPHWSAPGEVDLSDAIAMMDRLARATSYGNSDTLAHESRMLPTAPRYNDMVFALVQARVEALLAARYPDVYRWNQEHFSVPSCNYNPEEIRYKSTAMLAEAEIVVESYQAFFEMYKRIAAPADVDLQREVDACLRTEYEAKEKLARDVQARLTALKNMAAYVKESVRSDRFGDPPVEPWEFQQLGEKLKACIGYPLYFVPYAGSGGPRSLEFWCLLYHDVVDSEYDRTVPILDPISNEYGQILERLPSQQNWVEIHVCRVTPFCIYREVQVSIDPNGVLQSMRSPYSSLPHHLLEDYLVERIMSDEDKFSLSDEILRLIVPVTSEPRAQRPRVSVMKGLFGDTASRGTLPFALPPRAHSGP